MGASPRWIDLLDPTDEELEANLPPDVHARALERLRTPAEPGEEPRPRLVAHEDLVYGLFVVPAVRRRGDRVVYQEIDVVAKHELVVTIRKTPPDDRPYDISSVAERVAAEPDAPCGKVIYFLVDAIADEFLRVVDELDDEIDEVEDGMDTWASNDVRERIATLRRDLLHIRRALWPTRDALDRVADRRIDVDRGEELFPREIEYDFRDAYEKLLRANDGLEFARDALQGARDYHQAKIASDQNEVMKRLTVVASLVLVPTFIVGVYGQNFIHMPELRWHYGYLWSWLAIIVVTVAQVAYFQRKRWF